MAGTCGAGGAQPQGDVDKAVRELGSPMLDDAHDDCGAYDAYADGEDDIQSGCCGSSGPSPTSCLWEQNVATFELNQNQLMLLGPRALIVA